MAKNRSKPLGMLETLEGMLGLAVFSPAHLHDWLAFCFGQPALLGLEEEEAFDLFVRAAIAAETIHPELVEGRDPLSWLWSLDDPRPVLAQALGSLRADRPYLFHRALYSLPAVGRGLVNPEEFELLEDFLAQALGEGAELSEAAAGEIKTLRARALRAAGADPDKSHPRVEELVERVLERSLGAGLETDSELLAWLARGEGLEGVEAEWAPMVMAEVWARWAGALTGGRTDVGLLARLLPHLALSSQELALYAPVEAKAGHVISAECPFCGSRSSLRLGDKVKELARCPHLVFVGSGDEAHLMDVLNLGGFELGQDFLDLLWSYYESPADLELFATIVNDLYEMLREQGRLEARPVESESAPRAFYNLRAYFTGPPPDESTRH